MAEEVSGPLSPERNESIFRNDIVPDCLPDAMRAVGRPRLILLGGQPGAGKTAVLIASHAEFEQSGSTVRIVGDDLRSYHPQFLAFQRQDPETASQFTQADAGRWSEKLLIAAAERQVNIVFETTMRTPENVARVIGMARRAGYEVEARAVAVNPRLSWQGNHYRFEEMLRLGDAARIPPEHIHDAAVDGLRVSLEKVEAERLADRVQLRTRGGTVLYDNETRNGEWQEPPRARQALEAEHTRPMTRGELQRFADDWSYVLSRMEERNAPDERIGAVRRRAAEDVSFLLAQRREADGEEHSRRGRAIFQRQADTLNLFVELYDNTIRDAERRPVGNIEAHAFGRLTQTYMALKLIEAARDLGLLPEDGKIVGTRAMVQDKRGSQEFPSAHRLPADLAVETPDGSRRRLTDYLEVALNRVVVDRDVFSRTDRLSRMANVVDSWLEAGGMRKTLARAANAVATGSQSADSAMAEMVEPGYAAAIVHARHRLDRNMAIAERAAIATAIVDTSGEPFRAMRDDLRLRTADLENRARAKAMMDAVLVETARHRHLDPEHRRAAEEFIRGIGDNERNLGTRRSPDRSKGPSDPLVPARNLPDLTEPEISDRLYGASRLAGKRSEIENLSRLVYGNSQTVSASLDSITDARSGATAADDVRTGRLGDLAGQGRTWLRGPSPERQTAEANAPRLATALADYGLAVDFERYQIVTQHREEQARQRVEIPRPSSGLSEVLRADSQEQRRRLASDPPLRRELESLTLAITKRLSPVEKIDLKDGNTARLASFLGISPEQATALRGVYERARVVQERAMRQNHDLSRTNQLDIQR
ncbi:zeta toxin family protein [Agrobacterium salinitolerans]|uniref:Zeta toxin n=1 Tax=Agrobacterium salinitolerans TaxID=1183413 RepID=A0A9X3KS16_9HYPH|nr:MULTISPECIES: zeta toxin family protein [Agrobacterium]MCZ7854663.1 zeta toxin family protein [Agrobacterium salinitolerans]MCZ7893936.1 zeta toxin family protein [Agrobacterium salinitolerans]MCZ7939887.1 zeta toxin family protein [Agrobacterium salinitolerans]TRA84233.1 zeta toxin [Agrobacterium salinitolerans]